MLSNNLDIEQINKINMRYRFKIKEISPDTCYIDSGQEEWLITATSAHKGIILFHKNMKYDTDKYHIQHLFYTYQDAIHSIYEHKNKWRHKFNKVFKMKKLFEQIDSKKLIKNY